MDIIRLLLCLTVMATINPACAETSSPPLSPTGFSTTKGLGFDKQISIWLIEKYITPQTPVIFFIGDAPPAHSRMFDESNSEFMRTADHSTYEQLVKTFKPDVKTLESLIKTVSDIEINLWQEDELPDSVYVEKAFRTLQEKWGRENVPRQCYTEFFNRIETLLNNENALNKAESIPDSLSCWHDAINQAIKNPDVLVPAIPIPTLLGHLHSGAKVAFIDVREPDEYAENHIPGAINLLIKDANKDSIKNLKNYDLVIAYCIKDFRGFEMARKLKDLGISQAAILKPYGIKGWIDSNLPVYQYAKTNEEKAAAQLGDCIAQPGLCAPKSTEKKK